MTLAVLELVVQAVAKCKGMCSSCGNTCNRDENHNGWCACPRH